MKKIMCVLMAAAMAAAFTACAAGEKAEASAEPAQETQAAEEAQISDEVTDFEGLAGVMTEGDMEAAYGECDAQSEEGGYVTCDYRNVSFTFDSNNNGVLCGVVLHRPSTAITVSGIYEAAAPDDAAAAFEQNGYEKVDGKDPNVDYEQAYFKKTGNDGKTLLVSYDIDGDVATEVTGRWGDAADNKLAELK